MRGWSLRVRAVYMSTMIMKWEELLPGRLQQILILRLLVKLYRLKGSKEEELLPSRKAGILQILFIIGRHVISARLMSQRMYGQKVLM